MFEREAVSPPKTMQVNLRTLLVVPLLALLFLVSLLIGVVVSDGQERTIDGLIDKLVDQVSGQITDHLDTYLSSAQRLLDPITNDLENGLLDPSDHAYLRQRLRWLANTSLHPTTLGFGATDGHYLGYSGITEPALYFSGKTLYELDSEGIPARILNGDIEFDARQRPWYISAVRDGASWSPIYPWEIGVDPEQEPAVGAQLNHQLGLSAVRVVRQNGQLIGVIENALTLAELSHFLGNLRIGSNGSAFIVDADGLLIANSLSLTLLRNGKRIRVLDSGIPRQVTAMRHLQRNPEASDDQNFVYNGERHHLRSTRFGEQYGLDWRVVVVIPEEEFTPSLAISERNTLLFSLLSLGLVGLLGMLLAERVAQPIERLVRALHGVTEGHWPEAPPMPCHIREVNHLGASFHQMSQSLRGLFHNMERQVEKRTTELLESRRILTTLISNLPGVAYRCSNDRNWTMSYLSDGCEQLTGYPASTLLDNQGLNYADLILPENRDEVWRKVQSAISIRQGFRLNYRIRHHDGTIRWVMEQGRGVFDSDGKLLALEGLFNDITDLKRTEEELQRAKREAEEANQAKSRFLTNMSHEIRTPLHAILGFTEVLLEQQHPPETGHRLEAIETSGQALLGLIDDILDLSRVEAGKLALEPIAFEPRRLFEELNRLFAERLERRGLYLRLSLADNIPEWLEMDRRRLRQVLINLLGNALKFTQEGGIVCTMEIEPHSLESDHVALSIQVCDTGIGIPEEHQERIFQPFAQIDSPEHPQGSGTGLGLAIACRLTEMMGGELSVISQPGCGSCFSLYFSRVPIAQPVKVLPSQQGGQRLPEATLIVADDLELNRSVLCAFLHDQPVTLLEADNGWKVVELARRHHPDLILMDIRMPELDGMQAARLLRENSDTTDIPIIAITADAMKEQRQTISRYCDAYLAKPVGKQDLLNTISRYLGSVEKN